MSGDLALRALERAALDDPLAAVRLEVERTRQGLAPSRLSRDRALTVAREVLEARGASGRDAWLPTWLRHGVEEDLAGRLVRQALVELGGTGGPVELEVEALAVTYLALAFEGLQVGLDAVVALLGEEREAERRAREDAQREPWGPHAIEGALARVQGRRRSRTLGPGELEDLVAKVAGLGLGASLSRDGGSVSKSYDWRASTTTATARRVPRAVELVLAKEELSRYGQREPWRTLATARVRVPLAAARALGGPALAAPEDRQAGEKTAYPVRHLPARIGAPIPP